MSTSISRSGSAQQYDTMLRNLAQRESQLADIQEKVVTAKRVLRPSDDPSAAGQAERALMRMSRIKSEVSMLEAQKGNLSQTEATLGQGVDIMQRARELIISSGNGSLDATQRASIASELDELRTNLLGLANRKDSNGLTLFGGLGSDNVPFVQTADGVAFEGLPRQTSLGDVSLSSAVDGQRTWMFNPVRDGVFESTYGTHTGQWSTAAPELQDLSQLQNSVYQIQFSTGGNYTVVDAASSAPLSPPVTGTLTSGEPIVFKGLAVTITGSPANGDTLDIAPVGSVFDALDRAAQALRSDDDSTVTLGINQAMSSFDVGFNQILATRGQIGEMLNQADRVTDMQAERQLQLESDRSRLEDLDMAEGLSQQQLKKAGYDVALQTYAQIQRLSLFNYIS